MELPRFKCHKVVQAFKIIQIDTDPAQPATVLRGDGGISLKVPDDYLAKQQARVGGYWVKYDDGYESYSPAEAFEAGYAKKPTPLPPDQPAVTLQARIKNDFVYHAPKPGQPETYAYIRDQAKQLALELTELCPLGRELSTALTKLEEVVFWANASIARSKD